ncbi:MAG TPA: hypothetical protein ENK66_04660 [Arcobacter sp.]|nr:hypothetical protein [Arcobacter sp.]
MSKVYITKASTNLILHSLKKHLNVKQKRNDLLEELSEHFSFELMDLTLNDMELEHLYNEKNILKSLEELLNKIKNNNRIVKDYIEEQNRKYAYNIKEPAYHTTIVCEWLNKDFQNIVIPEVIQNNELILEEFKIFIQDNEHLNFNELNSQYQSKFKTKDNLKKIKYKNSGNLSVDNIKAFSEVKEYFENLPLDGTIQNYRYAPLFKIEKLLKDKKKVDTSEEYKEIEKLYNTKKKFMNIIFNTHKEKYNQDLSFSQDLLDEIGFKKCKGCSLQTSTVSSYYYNLVS